MGVGEEAANARNGDEEEGAGSGASLHADKHKQSRSDIQGLGTMG